MEEQKLTPKEMYDASRLTKLQGHVPVRAGSRQKSFLIWGVAVLVLVLAGFGVWWWLESLEPETEDHSIAYEDKGREHIPVGSAHDPYNSNPPTSGSHYEEPAMLGLYAIELPDERLVHNLEHGEIWVAFHPRVKDAIWEDLKSSMTPRVVATPRSANDIDIAVVAWGRLDAFDLKDGKLDTARVRDFIARYQNRGPERVVSDTMLKDPVDKPVYRP